MNNKWIRAAIPALLIHCSIGTVYCWSTFKTAIAEQIGMSTFSVGWAFSLAIFFLGMSAAFCGNLVEKNIHKSSLISCICFSAGMIGTGLAVHFLTGTAALIVIYLCYGCLMGIGLGIGYLTPVKTLMLWFKESPGIATGISIAGFGLAKAIATPVMELIQSKLNIASMFYILGTAYFIVMFIGHKLLKKPDDWIEPKVNNEFKFAQILKNKDFILIWLMFYINIHCGLALISYEKQLLSYVGLAGVALAFIPSLTALFNATGRLGYSALSDKLPDRNYTYYIIFISSILITALGLLTQLKISVIVIILLLIINAGYGGGFSTLPALLSSRFGMKNISKIHGLALSAWAIAGLTGNNLSELILKLSNNNYYIILVSTGILYVIGLTCSYKLKKKN